MKLRKPIVGVAIGLLATGLASTQDFESVKVESQAVAGGVHMLTGAGGNMAASVGPDGILLVDDQYAPLTERIRTALAKLSSEPLRFVINTHWHGDHTGGNENLGRAGALIVAHEGVRKRMSVEQFMQVFDRTVPASPAVALPVVTFTESVTLHLNGEEIRAFHVPPAHTDGDSIIHFVKADVVHMGDVFFNGNYPFVDVGSGGSIDDTIAAVERVLGFIGDGTRIIPGHGPLAGRAELTTYRDGLADIRRRIAALIAENESLEEIQAAKPTAAYDEKWGKGFIKPNLFVSLIYSSLTGSPPQPPPPPPKK